jgi:hypothetical protein
MQNRAGPTDAGRRPVETPTAEARSSGLLEAALGTPAVIPLHYVVPEPSVGFRAFAEALIVDGVGTAEVPIEWPSSRN